MGGGGGPERCGRCRGGSGIWAFRQTLTFLIQQGNWNCPPRYHQASSTLYSSQAPSHRPFPLLYGTHLPEHILVPHQRADLDLHPHVKQPRVHAAGDARVAAEIRQPDVELRGGAVSGLLVAEVEISTPA